MSFAGALQEKADKLKIAQKFKENPLSTLIPTVDSNQKVFEYYLDESCVKIRNIVELRAHLNYVKLKDISSKLNLSRSWFTISVICEVHKKNRDFLYTISDLRTCRYKLLIKFPASYRTKDVVLFIGADSNCAVEVDNRFNTFIQQI